MTQPRWLRSCAQHPAEHYDVALLDLDGVIYVGADAVPGAASALVAASAAGMRLGFVTNNASRSAAAVAAHLRALGVPAQPDQVITSAQTAARVMAERLPAGSRVLIVGAPALADEITQVGLIPVTDPDPAPAAVVQGYSTETGWAVLAAACRALRAGAWWVATNVDATVPSAYGLMPGNGAFVDVVARTTGQVPLVTGKPEPAMHQECLRRLHAKRPLVVGDRLDTDIEGANRVGCDSLLVLTGVTDAAGALGAPVHQRPTYLADNLGGLLTAHPAPTPAGRGWVCGGWTATRSDEVITLGGAGDTINALRALCAAAWQSSGAGADKQPTVSVQGSAATAAAAELGVLG